MNPIFLHDKATIEAFLRRDPYLHLYALGDLDDFFWPYTSWYACQQGGQVQQLFLQYSGGGLPVILAIAEQGRECLRDLLSASLALLPRRFYSHLSPGLSDVLSAGGYRLKPHGRYLKMALTNPSALAAVETGMVENFGPQDEAELVDFYNRAYPGNWFDARMLATGCYYGLRLNGAIASVAGIHVYSPHYRAAALGNITTLPEQRGKGLAALATARLCQQLRRDVDHIGLNVRADNRAAITVYTRLGFTPVAEYEEYMVEMA